KSSRREEARQSLSDICRRSPPTPAADIFRDLLQLSPGICRSSRKTPAAALTGHLPQLPEDTCRSSGKLPVIAIKQNDVYDKI
ncbi:hypothetical protein, partial [uncultured Parabacteroides sp.]|uniref:hypothetical protein n=1 Tax=uncultured Parabacteroides sp. TaxID=512312 RepID=UPI0025EECF5E